MKLYDDTIKKPFITKITLENLFITLGSICIAFGVFIGVLSYCNFISEEIITIMRELSIMCMTLGFVNFIFLLFIHFVIKK